MTSRPSVREVVQSHRLRSQLQKATARGQVPEVVQGMRDAGISLVNIVSSILPTSLEALGERLHAIDQLLQPTMDMDDAACTQRSEPHVASSSSEAKDV